MIITLDIMYNGVLCPHQAGFAGDDAPRAEFPALVGRPRHQASLSLYIICTVDLRGV